MAKYADGLPYPILLNFRPQMQMTQYAFDPHSHNTIPYDQPSLVSR